MTFVECIGGPLDGGTAIVVGDAMKFQAVDSKTWHLYRLRDDEYRYVGVIDEAKARSDPG